MTQHADMIRQCAQAIDALRRRTVPLRAEAQLMDIPDGFLTLHPPSKDEPFASSNKNAACWYVPGRKVTAADIACATGVFAQEGLNRAFLWFGPHTTDATTAEALIRFGASRVPWVRYPVLVRSVDHLPCDTGASVIDTRRLEAQERAAFLNHIAPWYSQGGVVAAAILADRGFAELFGAWVNGKPAGLAALIPIEGCANLGWAGTDPTLRGRGCQRALIKTRVTRARELGLEWCVAETVTAEMTSTNNLLCAGFVEVFAWEVWEWTG